MCTAWYLKQRPEMGDRNGNTTAVDTPSIITRITNTTRSTAKTTSANHIPNRQGCTTNTSYSCKAISES